LIGGVFVKDNNLKIQFIKDSAKFISENIIVYTRSGNDEYKYFYKSPNVNEKYYNDGEKSLTCFANMFYQSEIDNGYGKSSWHYLGVENGCLLLRVVMDGRIDEQYRLIRRIEGAFFPKDIDAFYYIPLLQDVLKTSKEEFGNYKSIDTSKQMKKSRKKFV
jgi:hypothetical protein